MSTQLCWISLLSKKSDNNTPCHQWESPRWGYALLSISVGTARLPFSQEKTARRPCWWLFNNIRGSYYIASSKKDE